MAPSGTCGGVLDGKCVLRPDVCAAVAAPVCGCDGKTYGNLCKAQKAGAVVASSGACGAPPKTCAGIAGLKCPAGQICDLHGCWPDAGGVCVAAPPASCPSGGTAECGCDGNTWPNACFRYKAGVARDYAGACLVPQGAKGCKIGPVKPLLCDPGQYCRVPVGVCVGEGVCVNKPKVCDKSSKPVCGCDAKTYANPCLLEQSGFSTKAPEPCGS